MKRYHVLLVYLITLNSDLFASQPTFINIITNSDTIHNPTLTGVSETEITLNKGIVILIDDVNAAIVYGPTKRFPILAGVACGYLGFCFIGHSRLCLCFRGHPFGSFFYLCSVARTFTLVYYKLKFFIVILSI